MKPSVSHDALRWFLRLQDPDCSDTEQRAFQAWLAADFCHQREYEALRHTWDRMDLLRTKPFPELQQSLQADASHAGARRLVPLPAWLSRATAVAAILALVIGVAWWWTTLRVTVTMYQTAKGEQRTVTLPDGSIIDLNTDTALAVHLSGRVRRVSLERGEAFFNVVHDSDRPFDVDAAGGHIQDIGTQFTVHRQPDRVMVAVLDGAVQVATSPGSVRVLSPGERVFYTSEGRLSAVEPVEPHLVAGWRQGTLIFDGLPLADAIREVNRYWPGQILLTDHKLGTVKVKGIFNSRNLHEFFTALPEILPVEVVHTPQRVVIKAKDKG